MFNVCVNCVNFSYIFSLSLILIKVGVFIPRVHLYGSFVWL